MNSWTLEAQVSLFRTFKAPFLSFIVVLLSLIAAPNPIAMLSSSGGYASFVSLFIAGLKGALLPAGWHMITTRPNESTEIYVTASVMLALLVSSPMVSYQVMRFIALPLEARRRDLYALTVVASVLLAAGTIFGYLFLANYYLSISAVPSFFGFPPSVDAAAFYFAIFRALMVGAIGFTLPVYIYALIRFRRTKVTE